MDFLIMLAIVLTLALIVAGVSYYAYRKIKKKITGFSRMAFGTDSIQEGLERTKLEYAQTPKSVAGMTELYLPKIEKDFPQFNYAEMRERAENVLVSYLQSIHQHDVHLLTEGTEELKDKLRMHLEMLAGREEKEYFDNIKVHRTEITRYRKSSGRCSVIFQSSVEYVHYIEKDGKVIKGNRELKKQSKYNVELIYIQDRELAEDDRDMALGLNCPNCGAPIRALGAKVCAYCDTPVIEWNIHTWNFSSVDEIV